MWTRKNIAELIYQKYKIEIKPSTLGYYLERWGFSVQRPVKRAYSQDAKKIDKSGRTRNFRVLQSVQKPKMRRFSLVTRQISRTPIII